MLVSNTSDLSIKAAAKYDGRGLVMGEHYDAFVTSGDVAKLKIENNHFEVISTEASRYCYLGKPNLDIFSGASMTEVNAVAEADFIYLGRVEDASGTLLKNQQEIRDVFGAMLAEGIKHGKPMFCPNPDEKALREGGIYTACQGMVARIYEEMGGKVEWCGKPYVDIFDMADQAAAKLNGGKAPDRDKICMIGDTLETDILGAAHAGIRSVLLTMTGTFSDALKAGKNFTEQCKEAGVTPDFMVTSIAPQDSSATVASSKPQNNRQNNKRNNKPAP